MLDCMLRSCETTTALTNVAVISASATVADKAFSLVDV
jgi:hypothetical protein